MNAKSKPSRRDHFQQCLPVLDAFLMAQHHLVAQAHPEAIADEFDPAMTYPSMWQLTDGQAGPLAIVGPSLAELSELMPDTFGLIPPDEEWCVVSDAESIDEYHEGPWLFPVAPETDFSLLALCMLRVNRESFRSVDFAFALPTDHKMNPLDSTAIVEFTSRHLDGRSIDDAKKIIAKRQDAIVNYQKTDLAFLLATFGSAGNSVCVVSEEALDGSQSKRYRKDAAKAFFEFQRPDYDPDNTVFSGQPTEEGWLTAALKWGQACSPNTATAVWSPISDSLKHLSLVHLSGPGQLSGSDERFQYRRMIRPSDFPNLADEDFWTTKLGIRFGDLPRNEDDRFIVREQVSFDHNWSPRQTERSEQLHVSEAIARGYPILPLSDNTVCSLIDRGTIESKFIPTDTVVVPLEGKFAGAAITADNFSNGVAPVHAPHQLCTPEDLEGRPAMFLKTDSPEFLAAEILGSRDYLLGMGYGPMKEPVINTGSVRELRIVWPGPKERKRLGSLRRHFLDSQNSEWGWEALENLSFAADELASKLRRLARTDPNTTAILIERDVAEVRTEISNFQAAFDKEMRSGDLVRPKPFLLVGLMDRDFKATTDTRHRMTLIFEHLDVLLKLRVCFLLTALEQLDQGMGWAFLADRAGDRPLKPSLGTWDSIGDALHKKLATAIEVNDRHHAAQFSTAVAKAMNPKDISIATQVLAKERNETIGHGYSLSDAGVDNKVVDLMPNLKRLRKRFDPLWQFPIHVVQNIRIVKHEALITALLLNGDNLQLDRTEVIIGRPQVTNLFEGSVCLFPGQGAFHISASPWLFYEDEVLWIFSGLDGKEIFYQSPMRPGQVIKRDA